MDTQILSYVSIVISVLGTIITIVNHKRIRSKCCGTVIDASIDINNTTPENLTIKVPEDKPPPPYTPL